MMRTAMQAALVALVIGLGWTPSNADAGFRKFYGRGCCGYSAPVFVAAPVPTCCGSSGYQAFGGFGYSPAYSGGGYYGGGGYYTGYTGFGGYGVPYGSFGYTPGYSQFPPYGGVGLGSAIGYGYGTGYGAGYTTSFGMGPDYGYGPVYGNRYGFGGSGPGAYGYGAGGIMPASYAPMPYLYPTVPPVRDPDLVW